MLGADIVVSARSLSKMYRLYETPKDRLKQQFFTKKKYYSEFWALENVSFEIKRGESLAVLGHNGAGKSTLLQILAGTVHPTKGEVLIRGRIGALMALGSGFRFDFTGRENIYVLGALLGIPRNQIKEQVERVETFAELGIFLDQPVRTYSNGMLMRLAFGVYTCMAPELLIVDEVLHVGDDNFKDKCLRHITQLLEKGTSMLLVSHDPSVIEQFCQTAVVLEKGRIVFKGDIPDSLHEYNKIRENACPS